MPKLVLILEQPGMLSYFGRGLFSDTFNARVSARSLSSQSWPPFVAVLHEAQKVEVDLDDDMNLWERTGSLQWMYSVAECQTEFVRSDAVYFVPQLGAGVTPYVHRLVARKHEPLRNALMHFATVSLDRRLGLEITLQQTRSSFERALNVNSLETVRLGDPLFFDITHIALMPLEEGERGSSAYWDD